MLMKLLYSYFAMRIKSITVMIVVLISSVMLISSCYTKQYCTNVVGDSISSAVNNSSDEDVAVDIYINGNSTSTESFKMIPQTTRVIDNFDISSCDSVVVSFLNSGEVVRLFGNQTGKTPELSSFYEVSVNGNSRYVSFTIVSDIKHYLLPAQSSGQAGKSGIR